MGTRSMTKVCDEQDRCFVAMYRQFDGYRQGHGKELAEFLASGRVVNGLGGEVERVFNGAGCLAAQLVAEFKTEPGGIYLYPTDSPAEEWTYMVKCARVSRSEGEADPISIEVKTYGKMQFTGNRQQFLEWSRAEEAGAEED